VNFAAKLFYFFFQKMSENFENFETAPLNLELNLELDLMESIFLHDERHLAELMDLELVELVEPVLAGMFVDGRTVHPVPVVTVTVPVPVISPTLFSDWEGEYVSEAELDAEWIAPAGYPDPDLNTLAFYPRQVPHMFVNVSRSHWDEMKVGDHVCSICFEKFDETVTELNCTHGADGKHFFCQGCANTWWQTCLAGNHVPSCACCRTATASAVTWVKPRKRNGSELESKSESKRPRVVV
jgi:hypothetical protein